MENKIKWNNHKATFFEILKTQREKSKYTDATLAVDGKFYPVHKFVMSTCSEYFSDIFEKTPCKSPVIVLKDVTSNDIEGLLDYMYQGEVDVNQNDLASLLKTAKCLRIKGLGVTDEYQTELSQNSTSIHDDGHQNSRPPKRRRHDLSTLTSQAASPVPLPQNTTTAVNNTTSTIPRQSASPVPLPQNTTTAVLNNTPKILYPNPPNTENSATALSNSAHTPSILSYSTTNTSNTIQDQPTEVKVEFEDAKEPEIGVISKHIYMPGLYDKVCESDILKREHDLENDDNTCFPGPSLQDFSHSTSIAKQVESLVVKVGLDGVKEKDIGIRQENDYTGCASSDHDPFAFDGSDISIIEQNEEFNDVASSAGPSIQPSVEMATTYQGLPMPIYNGYKFRLDIKKNSYSFYRCCVKKCKGRIKINNEAPYRLLSYPKHKHDHLPLREGELEAIRARLKMKEMAIKRLKKREEIYTDVVSQLSPSARQHLASKVTCMRTMMLHASKAKGLPVNPKTLQDIIQKDEVRLTLDGEEWLIYEILHVEKKQMLVFSTEKMLTRLSHSDIHLMAEIYKVPSMFQKLYTIHVQTSNGMTSPVVFALLSQHDEATYRKLFQVIHDKCEEVGVPTPNPKTIMMGFDICIKNVINEFYPNSKIICNFFHLAKSTQMLLMDSGNSDLYRSDDFAIKFQMMNALAFLPVEDVIPVFGELQELFVTEAEKSFASYFGETYVRGALQWGQQEKYHPAHFPPEIWNLYHTVSKGDPITNNSIETWQHNFQCCMNKSKTSLFVYIDALKKEQKRAEDEIAEINAHRVYPRKNRATLERTRKIKQVLDDYGKSPNIDILTALTHCFNIYFNI